MADEKKSEQQVNDDLANRLKELSPEEQANILKHIQETNEAANRDNPPPKVVSPTPPAPQTPKPQ